MFLKTLKTSTEIKKIVERSVYLCREIALDIGGLIIIERRLPRPSTYSDVIYKLGKYGVIAEAFVQKFVYVAGLQNFLAHRRECPATPRLVSRVKGRDKTARYSLPGSPAPWAGCFTIREELCRSWSDSRRHGLKDISTFVSCVEESLRDGGEGKNPRPARRETQRALCISLRL